VELDKVDAAFWFSATDHTLKPEALPGHDELERLLLNAKGLG